MVDDLSSVLTIVRFSLLFLGAGALAVWAARRPDQATTLFKRLTQRPSKCAGEEWDGAKAFTCKAEGGARIRKRTGRN